MGAGRNQKAAQRKLKTRGDGRPTRLLPRANPHWFLDVVAERSWTLKEIERWYPGAPPPDAGQDAPEAAAATTSPPPKGPLAAAVRQLCAAEQRAMRRVLPATFEARAPYHIVRTTLVAMLFVSLIIIIPSFHCRFYDGSMLFSKFSRSPGEQKAFAKSPSCTIKKIAPQ